MKQTICLNMIVKDEAHIITKTFDNLLKYFAFDYYVISDTGSTDGTQELIKEYFSKKNIPGELIQDTWKAFDYNRTLALKHAYKKTDYLFIFDADDSIIGNFVLPNPLVLDCYNLRFGSTFSYKRPLLITNKKLWIFKGVLHEYLQCLETVTSENIEGGYYVDSGRLGTRSKNPNKYADDAVVLEKAILTERDPKMKARYIFYCAQSYKDSNNIDKAIEWYTKQIDISDAWVQEKYYSALTLGDLYATKEDYLNATKYWVKTGEYDPERIEGIAKACEYYRKQGNHLLVDLLYNRFKNYSRDLDNKLFVSRNFYDYCLEFEFSVVSYYLNKRDEGYSCCKAIIINSENMQIVNTSIYNLQFFKDQIDRDPDTLDLFNKYDWFLNTKLKTHKLEFFDVWTTLFNKNNFSKFNNYKFKNKIENIKIVMTFTTCKRLDLFKKTINSIINNFEDLSLVDFFYCVDDNSSKADRAEMQKKYPWITYYFKSENEKGHMNSMNNIYSKLESINPEYWIHMEDDFLFYKKMNYITESINVIKKYNNIKQVLFNRAYGEIIEHLTTKGYLALNDQVVVHDYQPGKIFQYNNVHFWPGYSFRPSLIDFSVIKKLGDYTTPETFFEMEYSKKFESAGYKVAYFNFLTCRHIGRLTTEINDPTKTNAYILNKTEQFAKKEENNTTNTTNTNIKIINLKKRTDRKAKASTQLVLAGINNFDIIEAVDGLLLQPNEAIINIFKGNDFNSRKGIIGCALSHLRLWQQLLNDPGNDYYIIMEDDFVLNKHFKENIEFLSPQFIEKDCILLGYLLLSNQMQPEHSNFGSNNTAVVSTYQFKKWNIDSFGGMHCYSINKQGAKKMIDYINTHGIKHGIDYVLFNKGIVELYNTTPMLAFQEWHEGLTKKIDSNIVYSGDSFSF